MMHLAWLKEFSTHGNQSTFEKQEEYTYDCVFSKFDLSKQIPDFVLLIFSKKI